MMQGKISSFTDLNAWQESHKLAVEIYEVTGHFPATEQFGLTSQIRRAAVSITSNIAEGFSRSTKNDKLHFYVIAKGSTTEVQNQLLLARDVGLLPTGEFDRFAARSVTANKLLTGLMKALNDGKGVKP